VVCVCCSLPLYFCLFGVGGGGGGGGGGGIERLHTAAVMGRCGPVAKLQEHRPPLVHIIDFSFT